MNKLYDRPLRAAVNGLLILAIVPITGLTQDRTIERDDFTMNSISGGEFRRYVTEHLTQSDAQPSSSYAQQWQHSMQTFGVLHNLMHEMMTDLAHYGASRYPDVDLPSFDLRISGGQWTDYQESLAEAYEQGHPWRYAVTVLEVMHDRVHHAMVNAVRFDIHAFERDASLSDYADEERVPHAEEDTLPSAASLKLTSVDKNSFREFVWHEEHDDPYLHAALHKLIAFDVMLRDIQTQWLTFANNPDNSVLDSECQYQLNAIVGIGEWYDYAHTTGCEQQEWVQLLRVTDLMQRRVNHAIAAIMMEQGVR